MKKLLRTVILAVLFLSLIRAMFSFAFDIKTIENACYNKGKKLIRTIQGVHIDEVSFST
jgi:hypothetical protein